MSDESMLRFQNKRFSFAYVNDVVIINHCQIEIRTQIFISHDDEISSQNFSMLLPNQQASNNLLWTHVCGTRYVIVSENA